MKKIMLIAAGAALLAGLGAAPALAGATPAPAPSTSSTAPAAMPSGLAPLSGPPHQICDPDYCLNDWNGTGQYVRSYAAGAANNYFIVQYIRRCLYNGNYYDIVLSGQGGVYCPFTNHSFDNFYANQLIAQIVDVNTGKCVGDDPGQDGLAYETTCNNVNTGTGGGSGTVFVFYLNPNCPSGIPRQFISNRWTNTYGQVAGMLVPTSNGGYIDINNTDGAGGASCMEAA